jgi:hypothetical protein
VSDVCPDCHYEPPRPSSNLPGVPLVSGFTQWHRADCPRVPHMTREQQREWQEWLDDWKRCMLRAQEGASSYVIG